MSLQANRALATRNRFKQKVVFDKSFPFTLDLQFGDKGQLDVELEVEGIELVQDEDYNDFRMVECSVKKAEIINATNNAFRSR